MIKDEDLFSFKKECLFHGLQGNREWGSKIYEASKQSKQWCIAFWLIYVGFFVKEANSQITWLQIVIGVLGISFFLALDLTAHYFIEIVAHEGVKIDKSLNLLPQMTREELLELEAPRPAIDISPRTQKQKIRAIISMLRHETIIYFYFGLIFFMLIIFIGIKFYHAS